MRRSLFVLVVVLALGLVACGGDDETPPSATGGSDCADLTAGDTFTITTVDFAFEPSCFTARADQGITIVNEDSADHTFTIAGTEIDVTIPAGETFNGESVSGVLEPGTYDFACRIHPSMTGTVTVE
jgi:plastocyanin